MLELERNLVVLRRWWWLLILGAVIAGFVAYAGTKILVKPQYEATAVVSTGPAPQGQNGAYFADVGAVASGQLVANGAVVQAIKSAAPGVDASSVAENIQSTALQEDCITLDSSQCKLLSIRVQWKDPGIAVRLANLLSDVFIRQDRQRLEQGYSIFHSAIAEQERLLARLIRTNSGNGPAQDWLQAQYANTISNLYQKDASARVQASVEEKALQVARPALRAGQVAAPKASVNAILGALLGLLIAWALAFVATTSYTGAEESAAGISVLSKVRD